MIKSTTASLCASVAGGVLLICHIGPALAADVTVCPSGCDHTVINTAIAAANPGDRIVVGTPGRGTAETYAGFQMKDSIDVVSEGDNTTVTYTDTLSGNLHTATALQRATLTIIESSGDNPVVTFPTFLATSVTLDGFTVQHTTPGMSDWVGLIVIGQNSPTVKNNIVRNNQGPLHNGGITMAGAAGAPANPLIENNIIHYTNGPGIGAREYTAPTITGNTIFTKIPSGANLYNPAIGLADNTAPTITNNLLFSNGRAGVGSVEFGVSDTGTPIVIKGNHMHSNAPQAGVRITAKSGSSNVQVIVGGPLAADSNEFHGNMAGVYLEHADHNSGRLASALIENNSFHSNSVGIRAENMTTITIRNNSINNQIAFAGIRASHSDAIIIEDNEIHGNTFAGIRIWPEALSTPVLTIRRNNISTSGRGGILIDNYGVTGTISENHIYQNGYGGITFLTGMDLDIIDNEIDHNVRGGLHTGMDLANGGGYMVPPGPGVTILDVIGNKIHNNGQGGVMGGGIDLRHATGVIKNNLVYENLMGGIRYGDFTTEISGNTVVANGKGGIAFDNLAGNVVEIPPQGSPTAPIPIKNNILANNGMAGINAGTLYSNGATCGMHVGFREYNLLSGNNGNAATCPAWPPWQAYPCQKQQLGMCTANAGEKFEDPVFTNASIDDYTLHVSSPAVDAGDPSYPDDVSIPPGVGGLAVDMGAYGGSYGVTW